MKCHATLQVGRALLQAGVGLLKKPPWDRRRSSRPRSRPTLPPPRAGCAPKQEGLMPTEAKRETVAELRDELSRSRTLIVSEYRGLTVKEIAEIRRALARQDVRYRVVK